MDVSSRFLGELEAALAALRAGGTGVRLPAGPGRAGELAAAFNALAGSLDEAAAAGAKEDRLRAGLVRLAAGMRGLTTAPALAALVMREVPPLVGAPYGCLFLAEGGAQRGREDEAGDGSGDGPGGGKDAGRDGAGGGWLVAAAGYGLPEGPEAPPRRFRTGQSLVGQAARDRAPIVLADVPPGYVEVASGTGSTDPAVLLLLPVIAESGGPVLAVLELAGLRAWNRAERGFLDEVAGLLAGRLSLLAARAGGAEQLARADGLAVDLAARSAELAARGRELVRSAADLKESTERLAERDREAAERDAELHRARGELDDRARALARTSLYKSEFLANMSHELRTPLNSLLILAQLLAQNPEGNLTEKQVDYATVIHSAGSDLLQLINDILDLSRAEAGRLAVRPEPVLLHRLVAYADAAFRPVAEEKGLEFLVSVAPGAAEELTTDESRVRQVLRNLLSNALKFTAAGRVELRVAAADPDEPPEALRAANGPVLAFRVADTGAGIPADRLEAVFDAFEQGGGGTSHAYGGTGLGLSVGREIAQLLGGAITAESEPGRGSTFVLYLPVRYAARYEDDAFEDDAFEAGAFEAGGFQEGGFEQSGFQGGEAGPADGGSAEDGS
ncbi:ATP-binding protein [Streptomyces sp. NRRL S-87]|uniref:GAF domain-containing sensor histidine kinase n=1 Tax=Streptomyces sp. NRRL S-87 TaxID=1463920 RepID=UPI0006920EE6|nr:ATP-binding protein [Streptomyces sp. NRRL S-87]